MQPTGMQPITENKHVGVHTDDYGGVYETMVQNERQEGYTTLRNGPSRPQPVRQTSWSFLLIYFLQRSWSSLNLHHNFNNDQDYHSFMIKIIYMFQQDGSMSNYMVPKPVAHLTSAPHSPLSPVSPQIPGVKHINYPPTPQTVAQVSVSVCLSVCLSVGVNLNLVNWIDFQPDLKL